MASIVANAEIGVNYPQVFSSLREFTPKPMGFVEAMLCCVAKNAVDCYAGLILMFSKTGRAARLVSKYHPFIPVVVITDNETVSKQLNSSFSLLPYKVTAIPQEPEKIASMVLDVIDWAVDNNICPSDSKVIIVKGEHEADADGQPSILLHNADNSGGLFIRRRTSLQHKLLHVQPTHNIEKTTSIRCNSISLSQITSSYQPPRKTKIVCTMGPACWSEEAI
eukprot:316552-Hanusia_phi.AAC.1